MSTLGEHNGNGDPTETSLLPKDAKEKVDGVLLNFDVLPSRFDRFLFKYIYVYLIGLYLPAELLFILLLLQDVNLQLKVEGVGRDSFGEWIGCDRSSSSYLRYLAFQCLAIECPKNAAGSLREELHVSPRRRCRAILSPLSRGLS